MKKDHFRENSALDKGRKKVYQLKEGNIELLNPKDGSLIGYLEKGDLAYFVKTVDEKGTKMLVFKAMKLAGKKHQNVLFKDKKDLFEKHYAEDKDGKSSADGKTEPSDKKTVGKKNKFIAPIIGGLSLGALGFFIAKKNNKNILAFSIGGLIIGSVLGHLVRTKKLVDR